MKIKVLVIVTKLIMCNCNVQYPGLLGATLYSGSCCGQLHKYSVVWN